jgi:hypothetical protein
MMMMMTAHVTFNLRERHFLLNHNFQFYEIDFMQLVSSECETRPRNIWMGTLKPICTRRLVPSHRAVPLHATKALGGRGGIAPTHSRP